MNRMLLLLPALCATLAAPALAQDAPKVSNTEAAAVARLAGPSEEYLIGPEDVLDISVWKNPELSRKVPVRPDGRVSLPLVNDIQAAGLTPSELRKQLTARLAEFVPTPEVAVIVSEIQSLKVAVVGAVKTPGRFMLKSPATVLECIALAQGLTEFASRERIVVLRQNGNTTQRIPFNYRKVADGSEQDNFFVKPGDIIVVP
ncbi:MAG TPA: polysaccharide biosynthesis/export family protein [Vicinamibacterales bacterium]|nr:polysaccharide biosynthesis/export family protein [Vicinamibacterales bacterium]